MEETTNNPEVNLFDEENTQASPAMELPRGTSTSTERMARHRMKLKTQRALVNAAGLGAVRTGAPSAQTVAEFKGWSDKELMREIHEMVAVLIHDRGVIIYGTLASAVKIV